MKRMNHENKVTKSTHSARQNYIQFVGQRYPVTTEAAIDNSEQFSCRGEHVLQVYISSFIEVRDHSTDIMLKLLQLL